MWNLCIQLVLAVSFQPDLVGEAISKKEASKQGLGASKGKSKYWSPRLLHLPKSQQKAQKPEAQGNHASPHTHWRKGHWRNQAVGQGRTERKLTWIRPSLVNG